MKKNTTLFLVFIGLIVACLAFSLVMHYAGQGVVAETPVRKKDISGQQVNVVSIADVDGVMKMTAFNYLPDEFAELDETVSPGDDGAPAKRGTYRFYIDTLSIEEWAESENLSHLLKPDGSWHLTMYIPPVFSACSVFVQYQNQAYIGSISRYNIEYYVNYSSESEFDESVTHQSATQPLFIDIPISSDNKYSRECAVTIHYESDNENFVGLTGGILIGEDAAVRQAVTQNRSLLLTGAIMGAVTLLLFLFICILKRSLAFMPQLLFAISVFLAMFSGYIMFGLTAAPYFAVALRRLSVGAILFSSTLYLPKKTGRLPVLYPTAAAAITAGVLAFISPFCTSASAYAAVHTAYIVMACVCVAAVLCFTAFEVFRGKSLGLRLNCAVAGCLAIAAMFNNLPFPFILLSPAFWLCLIMLGITLFLGFREFISAEIRNRYLTSNLEQEVTRQTQSLKNLLAERDKILMYITHDMKKAVISMNGSLHDLKQSLSSPETVAKVDGLINKNAHLTNDFAELAKYGNQNYVAEQSEILNLSQIVRNVSDELKPDCEANGIILTVSVPEKLNVYAKKTALKSVILNLMVNAIEHSFCSHLHVGVIKQKAMCRLEITDDGTGVTTDKDIFRPFVSGSHSENHSGLGLFLVKSAVESMHGELTYERNDGLTIFAATLPLA